jgi:phosphoglucan,water dikinase
MLAVLPGAARRMGPALGVQEHAIATFAEAEVRASVAFQLSRLLALLQRAARVAAAAANGGAGLSEWEPIVAGTARGVLVDVPSLDCDAARRAIAAAGDKGVVLLLREATGDEELAVGVGSGTGGGGATSRPPLRGIALAQPLPHLSHLGVRARQERVPLATISPSALAREVLPLLGKAVELRVGADGSTVELTLLPGGEADLAAAAAAPAPSSASAAAGGKAKTTTATAPPDADRSKAREVVPLLEATAQTCGAKAASCARLLRLAAASSASNGNGKGLAAASAPLFRAPRGAVLPFGAMEAAADAAGVRAQYDALLERAEALSAEAAAAVDDVAALARLDAACAELRALVGALRPSPEAVAAVAAAFSAPEEGQAGAPATPVHLIARSSANVEDLAGLSGAGLYDSVPNVPFASPSGGGGSAADLGAAVAQVWASLHTRRAVLARRAAGVPQTSAAMAVLVQEQLTPDVAFVLHTHSPVELAGAAAGAGANGSNSSNGSNGHSSSSSSSPLALAELAPGLGETLAGASRGSGWRLLLDKTKGELASTLAFANFSEALVPPSSSSSASAAGVGARSLRPEALYAKASGRISGDVVPASTATLSRPADAAAAAAGRTYALARRPVDYSRQRLSADAASRRELGAALARVSAALEAEFGGEAQDAEGCVVGFNALGSGAPYQNNVVQSRPQP